MVSSTADAGIKAVDLLVHPVMIGSVVVVVANDHWGKAVFANHVTGKLSDAAGSLVLAGLLAVLWSWGVVWVRRKQVRDAVVSPRQAWLAVGVVVVGVAVAKTSAQGAHLAAWVLGVARWPAQLVSALAGGAAQTMPVPRPVVVVVDATDVVAALCAVALVWIVQRRACDRRQQEEPSSALQGG